jgi:hypothetical protein
VAQPSSPRRAPSDDGAPWQLLLGAAALLALLAGAGVTARRNRAGAPLAG